MAKQRYMMKLGEDFVYAYHPMTIDQRKDIIEITETQAKSIMAGMTVTGGNKEARPEVEKKEVEVGTGPPELPKAEPMPDVQEDKTEAPPSDDEDEDIVMLRAISELGKGKAKVEAYVLQRYNHAFEERTTLKKMVAKAMELRLKELAEMKTKPEPEQEQAL